MDSRPASRGSRARVPRATAGAVVAPAWPLRPVRRGALARRREEHGHLAACAVDRPVRVGGSAAVRVRDRRAAASSRRSGPRRWRSPAAGQQTRARSLDDRTSTRTACRRAGASTSSTPCSRSPASTRRPPIIGGKQSPFAVQVNAAGRGPHRRCRRAARAVTDALRTRWASTRSAPAARACPLHDVSLADVIGKGKPVAVMFATPALCQSQYCGPVLDELLDIMAPYHDKVDVRARRDLQVEPRRHAAPDRRARGASERAVALHDRRQRHDHRAVDGAFATNEISAALQTARRVGRSAPFRPAVGQRSVGTSACRPIRSDCSRGRSCAACRCCTTRVRPESGSRTSGFPRARMSLEVRDVESGVTRTICIDVTNMGELVGPRHAALADSLWKRSWTPGVGRPLGLVAGMRCGHERLPRYTAAATWTAARHGNLGGYRGVVSGLRTASRYRDITEYETPTPKRPPGAVPAGGVGSEKTRSPETGAAVNDHRAELIVALREQLGPGSSAVSPAASWRSASTRTSSRSSRSRAPSTSS